MRLIKILLIFFILFFPISCSNNIKNVYITHVYDGDSYFDSNKNKYRLFGIDTPELRDKNLNFTKGIKYFYAFQAKKKVEEFILNKKVKIQKIKIDKYNRQIVKIWINKIDISLLLIKSGLAIVSYIDLNKKSPFYTSDFKYYKTLLNLQYKAYNENVGIWKHKNSIKDIFTN